MNSKLTAFFAVLLMIASASAGAALLSDTGPSGISMSGGGVQENTLNSNASNDSDFILSGNQNTASFSAIVSINDITKNDDGQLCTKDDPTAINHDTTAISISNEEELNIFSGIVNGTVPALQSDFSGYTVILLNDIILQDVAQGESNFTPIGNSSNQFKGIFDGQGHTISNLIMNITSDSRIYAGLFGFLGRGSMVMNLGLVNSSIFTENLASYDGVHAGGIAGHIVGGTILNCYSEGNITAAASTIDAGGIVGYIEPGGRIVNCYNTGTVASGTSTTGANCGGIAGRNYSGEILNCYNLGNVTATTTSNSSCAGGISGKNLATVIQNCYNTGAVEATSESSSSYAGGIVGENNVWSLSTILTNCYNAGSISATSDSNVFPSYLGGIVGQNKYSPITNCYNTGNLRSSATSNTEFTGGIVGRNEGGDYDSAKITNCYNAGVIESENFIQNVGGIVGYNSGTGIKNTFYIESTTLTGIGNTQDDDTVTKKLTSENMKDLQLLDSTVGANNLNKDQTPKSWSPDIFGVNNGYPILADVPLSILLGHSAPKSAVYIVADDNEPQAENYLEFKSIILNETFKVKNVKLGSDLKVSETPSISWSKLTYDSVNKKYSWVTDSDTPVDGAISPANGETYQAVITFNVGESESPESQTQYHYTSLSRTAEVKYSVTYDANGGTGSMIDTGSLYSSGETVTILNNAFTAPEGKVFAGWSTDPNATTGDTVYDPGKTISIADKNITLHAVWKDIEYSVYYYSLNNDPVTVDDKNISGDQVTANPAPTKSGYEFKGWLMYEYGDTSSEPTKVQESSTFTMPSSDVIMIADWEKTSSGGGSTSYIKQYSVIYVSDADTANVPCDSKLYTSGSSASILENKLSKAGFISNGWNTKADGSGTQYNKGDVVKISSSNIILYAQFKQDSSAPIGPNSPNAVSVTFCIDNKVYETVYVSKGSCLDNKMPENPEKQNDKFKGWFYLDSENNEIEFTAESTVSSNTTVFAEFESDQASNASSSSTTIIIIIAVIIALIAAALIAYFFYFRKQ